MLTVTSVCKIQPQIVQSITSNPIFIINYNAKETLINSLKNFEIFTYINLYKNILAQTTKKIRKNNMTYNYDNKNHINAIIHLVLMIPHYVPISLKKLNLLYVV